VMGTEGESYKRVKREYHPIPHMLGAAAISLSYQTEPVFLDLPPLSRINTLSSVSYSGGGGGGGHRPIL
jgi:hypothetical protein